jgi:hypothetical protein
MIDASRLTDEEVLNHGLDALRREFGVLGTIRFLRRFDCGQGDYSVERHRWLDGLSLDDILCELPRLSGHQK